MMVLSHTARDCQKLIVDATGASEASGVEAGVCHGEHPAQTTNCDFDGLARFVARGVIGVLGFDFGGDCNEVFLCHGVM
jgi:hypothetical protein